MSRTKQRLDRLDRALRERLDEHGRAVGAGAARVVAEHPFTALSVSAAAGLAAGLLAPGGKSSSSRDDGSRREGTLAHALRMAATTAAVKAFRGDDAAGSTASNGSPTDG